MIIRDDSGTTPNMLTNAGIPLTFKQARKSVLNAVNMFLRDVEAISVGYRLHVYHSNVECGDRMKRLFTDTGIVGMVEEKFYETLDMVAPFVSAMIDFFCGLEDALTTTCFARYCDIFNYVFRYYYLPGRTDDGLT